MYVYERKLNKTKAFITVSFVILFLAVCLLILFRQNDTETVSVLQSSNVKRLQLPSVNHEESFILPYSVNAATVTHFYDASKEESILENAIVEFEGVYRPSQGVDYGFDDKVFEVIAMISGEVTQIKDDNLMGKSVTVQSQDVTVTYQSLSQVNVEEGDTLLQGTVIGLSGENLYNQSLGIHLHVVAEKDGKLIDPAELIGMKLSELE